MANFDMFDEEYGEIFITQQSRSVPCISLEDNEDSTSDFRSVLDPQYSDISDFEDETRERRLR